MSATHAPKVAPLLSVRLSGTGGQGLVLMGHLLAEAVALYDGLQVIQTKSYGPEARGGASRSDVLMSTGQLDDLGGLPTDILVCLSQQACDKYYQDLVPHGLLIVDSVNVTVVPTSRVIEVPLTEAAITLGSRMVTNVIALGLLSGISNVVPLASLKKAVQHSVKPAFRQLNDKALTTGYSFAKKILKEQLQNAPAQIRNYSLQNHPHAALPSTARPKAKAKAKTKA